MMPRWPGLPDEEMPVVDTVSRFAEQVLVPLAAKTDEEKSFVHTQLRGLAGLGVMGANLPESVGGPGLSVKALFAIVEIIAGACGSTASALTAHYLATDAILIGGSAAQRAAWLPRAAAGEVLGGFALTEPAAGSDPADMKTRALRTANGWHLAGSKCFISNGGTADFLVVFAVTDPAAKHRGISAFIVPRGTPGLSIGVPERTMGLQGGHVFTLAFDCHLPADALLGETEGKGFRTAMAVLDNGRVEVAAMSLGIAQAALDAALAYAKTRVIGGEALANRQGIRWQLADMALDIARARALALQAVEARTQSLQTGERFSLEASLAKLACSEMVGRVTDGALQIHGGYGFTRDFPIERYARDARIFRIYEGSSEVQRNIIAAQLLS